MRWPRSWSRTPRDDGSATLELAILTPALLLLLSLLVLGARIRLAETSVDQAAGIAARSATLSRNAAEAVRQADANARRVLDREGLVCTETGVDVDTGAFLRPPGTPGEVSVEVSCRIPLSDLALPGLPGSRWVSARAVSPLDTFRGRS